MKTIIHETRLNIDDALYLMLQEEAKKYPNWSTCLRSLLREALLYRDLKSEFAKLKEKD